MEGMSKDEFGAIRSAGGMTYAALGEYLGVELRSVQRYEAGERPVSKPIEKLMRLLEAEVAKKKGRKK